MRLKPGADSLGNHRKRELWEKILVAAALVLLSSALYGLVYLIHGDAGYIGKYVTYHLAFLPLHALVLGLILEEILNLREKNNRQRKLNIFLGIFFRQMGVEFTAITFELLNNRSELDKLIMAQPSWKRRDFRNARYELDQFKPGLKDDPRVLSQLMTFLREREQDILEMTRNPNLWEFERLYRTLVGLFHLIEESHFRGALEKMSRASREHLAKDAGNTLLMLLSLWLEYLEFLKKQHPVLFEFQVGVHNTLQPLMLEPEWGKSE